MKREFSVLLKHLLYWILIFAAGRIIFLSYYFSTIKSPVQEILAAFVYAFPLDLSTTCYLLIPPFLISFAGIFFRINHKKLLFSVVILFTVLFALITSAELCLFAEWGTKLHYKALTHLVHPQEVFSTATTLQIAVFFISVVSQTWLGIFLFNKLFKNEIEAQPRTIRQKLVHSFVFSALTLPMLIIGFRGGIQQIPVNQSDCYYSSENILNLAAVNSGWNLLHSITESPVLTEKNPYNDVPMEEACQRVKALHTPSRDTTISILKKNRPNIVLLILESWSADLIPSCGGDSGATKNFEKLVSNGLLFTEAYASGDRSDQGMASIFSGFPAQPLTTIIAQPSKFQRLPSLGKKLLEQGYDPSFYFGGQLSYGNIKSYMMYNGIEKIIEDENFEESIPQGKLGVHDEYVLERQVQELEKYKQPFFSSLFTLSTHNPFDMPLKKFPISWGGNENSYVNSVYYSDSCLGDYFSKAARKDWYDNTLFILVADHSKHTHRNHDYYSPANHKIPILFFGNVIKDEFRGKKINYIVSQNDLVKTVLKQLKIGSDEFTWSRDALNPYYKPFAYYSFINGVGWITPDGFYAFDYNSKNFNLDKRSTNDEEEVRNGKSYLQVMFQQYLDY